MENELYTLIQGYVERCIPDIARKCGCTNGDVIGVMAKIAHQPVVSIPLNKTVQMQGHDYTFEEVIALFSN